MLENALQPTDFKFVVNLSNRLVKNVFLETLYPTLDAIVGVGVEEFNRVFFGQTPLFHDLLYLVLPNLVIHFPTGGIATRSPGVHAIVGVGGEFFNCVFFGQTLLVHDLLYLVLPNLPSLLGTLRVASVGHVFAGPDQSPPAVGVPS